jgi:alpha-ketoglutarate-dependent sulfate ester dioxygenase
MTLGTTVTMHRLSDTIGAEVLGVDGDALVNDDDLAAEVRRAIGIYGVLVFRDFTLRPETQVELCSKWGDIDRTPGHHPVSGIYRVTLDVTKNAAADYLHGTFHWHIDGCNGQGEECPQMATMLTAVAVAAEGGDTEFASTYAAYEDLSEEERLLVSGLRVVHSLEASQRKAHPEASPEDVARWRSRPSSEHPLVWTHRDGRRSLVLGASADYVVDMDVDEGRKLLDGLLERSTTSDRVYRHEWSVGDTVIWDNRGVLHRAAHYESTSSREMLRTTILGDEPIQ